MNLKKVLALMLSSIMMCSFASISSSAEAVAINSNDGIAPAYEYADAVESMLSISSNSAECQSSCTSPFGVVQIKVEQTLEKHSGWFWIWNNVDGANWSKVVNGKTAIFENTKSGLTSGTYRLKSVFTITSSNGETETITVYSDEKVVS